VPTAAGAVVGVNGLGFIGLGLWGLRQTRRGLTREHIAGPPGVGSVCTAGRARAMAEYIRQSTLEATGGRTYAQTAPYVDAAGTPTASQDEAAKDVQTGQPVESPDHDLWIQSTTLQTALMQAYMAFRLAESTMAIGSALVLAGIGLVAAGRRLD
jgi:hypothetical protein